MRAWLGLQTRLLPASRSALPSRIFSASLHSDTVLSPGDVITLECTDLAFGGDGVCKLDNGFVVFVPRALPGEQLTARITAATPAKGFARAKKLESLRPHDNPTEPQCPHFGPCGGCALQSLTYSSQSAFKAHQVASLMQRVGKITNIDDVMKPIVQCEQTYEYRNKMEFSVEPGSLVLGLHLPGNQHQILPITTCSLQQPLANEILKEVGFLLVEYGEALQGKKSASRGPRYSDDKEGNRSRGGRGNSSSNSRGGSRGGDGSQQQQLQHVVLRYSVASDQYLINFVTSKDAREILGPVASGLRQRFGDRLAGCVNSVTARGRPTAERRIAKEYVLEGTGYLVERLCGVAYEISPNSFFQVNTKQAEQLFELVLAAADLQETETALDLYCGSGAITLPLAQRCKRVHGVEISEIAVDDARRNARRNNISNVKFTCSDANMDLPPKLRSSDVIVVDPARQGLTPDVVRSMRSTTARRLVYVSCNASTQARDIAALCDPDEEGDRFYLKSVTPVDMYPHTPHCECVAVLDRRED